VEPAVVRVRFSGAGLRAAQPPGHSLESLARAVSRCLEAMQAVPAPECLRDGAGDLTFFVPWSYDGIRSQPLVEEGPRSVAAFESGPLYDAELPQPMGDADGPPSRER
jgi:hypothetical protein